MSETPDTSPESSATEAEPLQEAAPEPGPASEITRESTGVPRIDEALERLDGLDSLEINQHPDEFDAIHRVLRESLASAGRDGDIPDIA